MPDSTQDALLLTRVLLDYYSFDLGPLTITQLTTQWSKVYDVDWIRAAVLEALYQGRYKAISINQILALWDRRGQIVRHFTHEFEQLICTPLLEQLSELSSDLVSQPPTADPSWISGWDSAWDGSDSPKQFLGKRYSGQAGGDDIPDRVQATPQPTVLQVPRAYQPRVLNATPPFYSGQSPKPIRVFQPEGTLGLNIVHLIETEPKLLGYPPIHQFIPLGGPSEFHSKLLAVAAGQT